MFAQTHAFEQFDGIGVQDLPCALARIDSEQDRNQSAHDMGITIAGKAARAVRAHSGVELDLARAALNLVGIAMRRLRQWRQLAPQLNQIAIAIVPVVQDRKIADDLVMSAIMSKLERWSPASAFIWRATPSPRQAWTIAPVCDVTPRVVHPSAAPDPATGRQGRRGQRILRVFVR
jgi:hypothetical protein